jgi:hypothetical protein
MAAALKQPKVDAAVCWELAEILEETLAWVDDDEGLEHRATLAIESFKFAVALESK